MLTEKHKSTLPDLSTLPDGAWVLPPRSRTRNQERMRSAAIYALWISDPIQDAAHLRLLIACLAEPVVLTGLLSEADRMDWLRLVGTEAHPDPEGRITPRPFISTAWHDAFSNLKTSCEIVDSADGVWRKGVFFPEADLQKASAEAQRAVFALQAIRKADRALISDAEAWQRVDNGGSK